MGGITSCLRTPVGAVDEDETHSPRKRRRILIQPTQDLSSVPLASRYDSTTSRLRRLSYDVIREVLEYFDFEIYLTFELSEFECCEFKDVPGQPIFGRNPGDGHRSFQSRVFVLENRSEDFLPIRSPEVLFPNSFLLRWHENPWDHSQIVLCQNCPFSQYFRLIYGYFGRDICRHRFPVLRRFRVSLQTEDQVTAFWNIIPRTHRLRSFSVCPIMLGTCDHWSAYAYNWIPFEADRFTLFCILICIPIAMSTVHLMCLSGHLRGELEFSSPNFVTQIGASEIWIPSYYLLRLVEEFEKRRDIFGQSSRAEDKESEKMRSLRLSLCHPFSYKKIRLIDDEMFGYDPLRSVEKPRLEKFLRSITRETFPQLETLRIPSFNSHLEIGLDRADETAMFRHWNDDLLKSLSLFRKNYLTDFHRLPQVFRNLVSVTSLGVYFLPQFTKTIPEFWNGLVTVMIENHALRSLFVKVPGFECDDLMEEFDWEVSVRDDILNLSFISRSLTHLSLFIEVGECCLALLQRFRCPRLTTLDVPDLSVFDPETFQVISQLANEFSPQLSCLRLSPSERSIEYNDDIGDFVTSGRVVQNWELTRIHEFVISGVEFTSVESLVSMLCVPCFHSSGCFGGTDREFVEFLVPCFEQFPSYLSRFGCTVSVRSFDSESDFDLAQVVAQRLFDGCSLLFMELDLYSRSNSCQVQLGRDGFVCWDSRKKVSLLW